MFIGETKFEVNWTQIVRLMRGVGFEPTNPYGMRFPSRINSSEHRVRFDLTPLTMLGNPRTNIQSKDFFFVIEVKWTGLNFSFLAFLF
jgi:hypothetical protein